MRAHDGEEMCISDNFLLMELELIKASLYLRTNEDAAAKFAAAFDQYFREEQA
jgi:hypothetical protein